MPNRTATARSPRTGRVSRTIATEREILRVVIRSTNGSRTYARTSASTNGASRNPVVWRSHKAVSTATTAMRSACPRIPRKGKSTATRIQNRRNGDNRP